MDYKSEHPESYAALLRGLFGGSRPIMTQVKIEMGNDRNNSTGPDPATMRLASEAANVRRVPGFHFPGETTASIEGALQRLLEEFGQMEFFGDMGEAFRASFCVGVAGLPEDGEMLEELLRAADRRLCAAKEGGEAPGGLAGVALVYAQRVMRVTQWPIGNLPSAPVCHPTLHLESFLFRRSRNQEGLPGASGSGPRASGRTLVRRTRIRPCPGSGVRSPPTTTCPRPTPRSSPPSRTRKRRSRS
jgi:GGDEF domain-containing protein